MIMSNPIRETHTLLLDFLEKRGDSCADDRGVFMPLRQAVPMFREIEPAHVMHTLEANGVITLERKPYNLSGRIQRFRIIRATIVRPLPRLALNA